MAACRKPTIAGSAPNPNIGTRHVVAALRSRSDSDPPERAATAEALAAASVVFVPLHLLEPYFVTTGMPHPWWALLGLAMARSSVPRITAS